MNEKSGVQSSTRTVFTVLIVFTETATNRDNKEYSSIAKTRFPLVASNIQE